MKPSASLRHLLAHVVDYAGLFPPAKLPLDEAIRNYARYRREADSWMLGRFVIPAARLAELDAYADLFAAGEPFVFSALARGGDSAAALLDGLRADLQCVADFRRRHAGRVAVDVLEIKYPPLAPAELPELFHAVAEQVEGSEAPLTPYFETALGAHWRATIPAFLTALKRFREDGSFRRRRRCRPPGFKLRCGGLEAAAFPLPEQVAFVIHACLPQRVPLKCTAGLHHPLRRFDAGVKAHLHGFVNLFGAGVLAQVHHLDEERLCELLADQDAGHFRFEERGFAWKDWYATAEEIRFARQGAVVSFGSCSFDEPRADLRALGWL